MGADGQRGCRGGNEQRSCEPPQADAPGGRGDHTPPCARAPDQTNALARKRECANQAVEQRARSGRCGSWTGAQDITGHWANPQGAEAKPQRRAHQANLVCDCARFAQCAVMLNRLRFTPGQRSCHGRASAPDWCCSPGASDEAVGRLYGRRRRRRAARTQARTAQKPAVPGQRLPNAQSQCAAFGALAR